MVSVVRDWVKAVLLLPQLLVALWDLVVVAWGQPQVEFEEELPFDPLWDCAGEGGDVDAIADTLPPLIQDFLQQHVRVTVSSGGSALLIADTPTDFETAPGLVDLHAVSFRFSQAGIHHLTIVEPGALMRVKRSADRFIVSRQSSFLA